MSDAAPWHMGLDELGGEYDKVLQELKTFNGRQGNNIPNYCYDMDSDELYNTIDPTQQQGPTIFSGKLLKVLQSVKASKSWKKASGVLFLEAKPLGKGKWGDIFGPFSNNSSTEYVIKVTKWHEKFTKEALRNGTLSKDKYIQEGTNMLHGFAQEAKLTMQMGTHPNICASLHTIFVSSELFPVYILEYGGEPLSNWISSKKQLPITQILKVAHDIACGMDFMHLGGASIPPVPLIHGDLKPYNIVVSFNKTGDPKARIIDFGMIAECKDTPPRCQNRGQGSLPWMAPEIFNRRGYNIKVDVYSYACVIFELLSNKEMSLIFEDPGFTKDGIQTGSLYEMGDPRKAIQWLLENGYRPNIAHLVEPFWKELIVDCWSGNNFEEAQGRPTFTEILERLEGYGPKLDITLKRPAQHRALAQHRASVSETTSIVPVKLNLVRLKYS